MNYLQRYLNGEYAQVWAELLALGSSIRDEPLYSDAYAVARETMLRARNNVELLVSRLTTVGYRFRRPEMTWQPPNQESLATLVRLEREYGRLPLGLHAWYEFVGSINFMGSYPQLSLYYDDDYYQEGQEYPFSDPLVIYPFVEELILELDDSVSGYRETGNALYELSLAPDSLHKANYSGGGPTEVVFPNLSIDAPLQSADWQDTLFTPYLRTCFQWGGFPGLRGYETTPTELLTFLTQGLLPL